ncbi:maleylacetoacetate isomerase [Rhizodiscina lignyota]|uniref:Maleylacetoacetate isomerase n=1 Tax=Rhizodiscina lignyota TaxID=1504668 RepID=A0A9P4I7Z8_9PEZI|nr:maleylacetoacetate isomerase [Rhizodiscina lignyota]
MSTATSPQLTLHTFFRSTSAGRIRVALNLKGLDYKPIFVNLFKDEHLTPEYAKLNPSRTVPLLVDHTSDRNVSIGQSQAALEYLEEAFPDSKSLLPPKEDIGGRAFVRAIVGLIVSDTQPVTSLRLLNAVEKLGADRLGFAREWTSRGLRAVEEMMEQSGKEGKYCYGDQVTMADVCLVSAMWNAVLYGVDLAEFPRVSGVYDAMSRLEEVKKALPANQGDAPKEGK